MGLVVRDLGAGGGRHQDVAGLLEELGVRDGLGAGEPGDAARLGNMGLELADVDPVRADDAALDIAHAGDYTALTPEQAGRDAPDVAESLDDDPLPPELLAQV